MAVAGDVVSKTVPVVGAMRVGKAEDMMSQFRAFSQENVAPIAAVVSTLVGAKALYDMWVAYRRSRLNELAEATRAALKAAPVTLLLQVIGGVFSALAVAKLGSTETGQRSGLGSSVFNVKELSVAAKRQELLADLHGKSDEDKASAILTLEERSAKADAVDAELKDSSKGAGKLLKEKRDAKAKAEAESKKQT